MPLMIVVVLSALILPVGCLSPPALHRAVLAYDDTVQRVGSEQLLLNILRARHYQPIHFTKVSSQEANSRYRLSRMRVLISNYRPDGLSPEERRDLADHLRTWPPNDIMVDIKPGHPSGQYPMSGEITLRSFNSVLEFLAQGSPEYAVAKDDRSGPVRMIPLHTLEIEESNRPIPHAAVSVPFDGRYYSIRRPASHGDATLERQGLRPSLPSVSNDGPTAERACARCHHRQVAGHRPSTLALIQESPWNRTEHRSTTYRSHGMAS